MKRIIGKQRILYPNSKGDIPIAVIQLAFMTMLHNR